jgi:hypothetical protein
MSRIELNIYYLICKYESILKISYYACKFIIYVITIQLNMNYKFIEFSWYILASLNLSLRLEKGVDLFFDIVYIHYQNLNKKRSKIFWNLCIKEEFYFSEAKKMIKISEKDILKKLRLRIPMKIKNFFVVENIQLKYLKKTKKINFLYYLLKKKLKKFFSFKNIFVSSLNIIWVEIWYYLTTFKNNGSPWWRFFNIREVELEYYDQLMCLLFSSTILYF